MMIGNALLYHVENTGFLRLESRCRSEVQQTVRKENMVMLHKAMTNVLDPVTSVYRVYTETREKV